MTVSVIIPVFNAERGIRDCLASVLAQTQRKIEVLCVDDGSTDASPDILAEHAARDRRIRVIRQENAGAGVARNTALDAAGGDAVVFMDPDDYYPSCDVLDRVFDEARPKLWIASHLHLVRRGEANGCRYVVLDRSLFFGSFG